jgi:hypothetical protein
MNDADRQSLEAVASALYFAAERIADLAERQATETPPPVAPEQWMRGARPELAELLRRVTSSRLYFP